MARVKVIGGEWPVPVTAEGLEATAAEISASGLQRCEPRNRGVSIAQHRRMMMQAALDRDSIKDLIPSDPKKVATTEEPKVSEDLVPSE